MSQTPVNIAEGTPSATSVPVDVISRASPEISTTTTADPGTAGTSLAVTARDAFSQSGSFLIRVENEEMLVTAGQGVGAGSFTVVRGQNQSQGRSAGVAHASGVSVYQVVGVQRVEPVYAKKQITYLGRVASFRTPGRAGTTGQKIFAIHNSSTSAVKVDVDKITIDIVQTAAAGVAPTVIPPIIRAWKFTAVPTNGTNLTKVPEDSALSSNAQVTVWGDASADGTGSTTTLTITLPAGTIITEEFKPRILVVGTSASTFYESFDRTTFFEGSEEFITLNAGEGVAVFIDYTVATANPTTDMWISSARWTEYTNA